MKIEEKIFIRCVEVIRMDVIVGLRWRFSFVFIKVFGWLVEWEGSCSCVLGRKLEFCYFSFVVWFYEVRGILRVWFFVFCFGEVTRVGGWEG